MIFLLSSNLMFSLFVCLFHWFPELMKHWVLIDSWATYQKRWSGFCFNIWKHWLTTTDQSDVLKVNFTTHTCHFRQNYHAQSLRGFVRGWKDKPASASPEMISVAPLVLVKSGALRRFFPVKCPIYKGNKATQKGRSQSGPHDSNLHCKCKKIIFNTLHNSILVLRGLHSDLPLDQRGLTLKLYLGKT